MNFYNERTGEITAQVMYAPCYLGMPFVTVLNGQEDQFAPIFSVAEKLHRFMRALREQIVIPDNYTVMTVTRLHSYCHAHFENRVRMMLDPVIVSADHTRYNEIVERSGKLFVRGE